MAVSNLLESMNYEQQVEFVHIQQMHRNPFYSFGDRTVDEITKTALSQLKVANAIRDELERNPSCIVMDEGQNEDSTADLIPEGTNLIAKVFPKGLTRSFNNLTLLQKKVLCELGGATVLLLLGKIQIIHKCFDKETCTKINNILKTKNIKGHEEFVFGIRESAVIECVKEITNKNPNLSQFTFLVVFGALHDFEPRCDNEGFVHRKINTVIADLYELPSSTSEQALESQCTLL